MSSVLEKVCVVVSFLYVCSSLSSTPSPIEIPLGTPGSTFDGIGGLSAGAGTRLLIDYPVEQRSWLLDFLFKPSFGASLQVLKVEIGGTGDSTIGTEDSHERTRGYIEMDRGYEIWFVKEALKRNPNIVLYGLPWTFPTWVEEAPEGFSSAAIMYLADWVDGFELSVGHSLDYLGWHNESPWENDWILGLRKELDCRRKQHVQLIVGDCGPNFQTKEDQFRSFFGNETLANTSVGIGLHYPNSILPGRINTSTEYYQYLSSLPGKKLWSSEEMSTPSTISGSRCLAKLLNRNYIDANLTSSIIWNIIFSWYNGLTCSGQGIIWAPEPWSGKVAITDSTWAVAHTTQFTEVGWKYVRAGSGYLPPTKTSYRYSITMEKCNLEDPKQRWKWHSDGRIMNGNGRCLTISENRAYTEICSPRVEQEFRSVDTMPAHIELTAQPGICLDRNQAGNIVDTYPCCMAPTCAQANEEWNVSTAGFVSNANDLCISEGSLFVPGGSGSYVTIQSPDKKDFTIIIETMANADSLCDYGNEGWQDIIVDTQSLNEVKFCIANSNATSCPQKPLNLYFSNFNSSNIFQPQPSPKFDVSCCLALSLESNSVYTLSTITTASKGSYPFANIVPIQRQEPSCASVATWTNGTEFNLPYTTNFSSLFSRFADFAEYFSDMQGIFRVELSPFLNETSNVLSQKIQTLAYEATWGDPFADPPTSLIGSNQWENYTISAVVRLPYNASDNYFAGVASRHGHGYEFSSIGGYKFGVTANNHWFLNTSCTTRVTCDAQMLIKGNVPSNIDITREWVELSLQSNGLSLTVSINGSVVGSITDDQWRNGYAGVFSGWHSAYFNSFKIHL